MTTLREALVDWSDWDDAVVAYGVVVGLFAGPGRDANRVVLTDNPVSAALRTGLLALVEAGVLEQREDDDEQFRWVDADRAAEPAPDADDEHGPLGGPADTATARASAPADDPGLGGLAAALADKGFVFGDATTGAVTTGAATKSADPADHGDVPTIPAVRPPNPVARKWWQRG